MKKAITGTKELIAALKRVGRDIAASHQEKAIKAALRPVQRAMAAAAPVATNLPRGGRSRIQLSKSVRLKVKVYPKADGAATVFGITGPTAPHAHLQELGWKQRGGGQVPGKHFAERAAGATATASRQIYLRSLRKSLKEELSSSR